MKRKLLSMLLCMVLLVSFFSVFGTGVAANDTNGTPSTYLAVYVQQGSSGTPVLIHTYSTADMENLTNTTQYYTGIDNTPAVVQGKAIGILFSTLMNNLQQYDAGLYFDSGDTINLTCTDGYSSSFTYDYLLGATRYYYPNLITSSTNGSISGSTSGALAIQPMFALTSYQAESYTASPITKAVLDNTTLDTTASYRFYFGLLSASDSNTVSKFDKWVDQMVIIHTPTPAPSWDLNDDHVCNIGDVVVVGLHWGQTGTAGWIPEDLNDDGVINIGDVVVLGLHWGQTW